MADALQGQSPRRRPAVEFLIKSKWRAAAGAHAQNLTSVISSDVGQEARSRLYRNYAALCAFLFIFPTSIASFFFNTW